MAKAINGIFEPFFDYVQKQLDARKIIISNNITRGVSRDIEGFEKIIKEALKKKIITEAQSQLLESLDPQIFYKYVTEKQCFIRMASGVDVRLESETDQTMTSVPYILEKPYETGHVDPNYNLTGPKLAKQYILEGGVQFYNKGGSFGGIREGFMTSETSKELNEIDNIINNWEEGQSKLSPEQKAKFKTLSQDHKRAFAYGDRNIRANAGDGFGIVPMPGILNADITTKSEDGSLRTATINWACHNRRQLSALEALYMRPGYPVLLEWGWVPYIKNDFTIENRGYGILDGFFNKNSSINTLNETIREQKEESGGNYDGFIGFISNFSFQAREDGGYDCKTELIAHGELLSSLKVENRLAPKIPSYADPTIEQELEPVDEMLLYLRAIKSNLDKAGDNLFLRWLGTNREEEVKIDATFWESVAAGLSMNYSIDRYLKFKDDEGNEIHLNELNNIHDNYAVAFEELINIIQTTSKIKNKDINQDKDKSYMIPDAFLDDAGLDADLGNNLNDNPSPSTYGYRGFDVLGNWEEEIDTSVRFGGEISGTPFEGVDNQAGMNMGPSVPGEELDNNLIYYSSPKGRFTRAGANLGQRRDKYLGFKELFNGAILKEISLLDDSEDDSGVRTNVFVRWDFICEIFNRRISPRYKANQNLVQFTYLEPHVKGEEKDNKTNKFSQTWDGEYANVEEGKIITEYSQSYVQYSLPPSSRLFPYEDQQYAPYLGSSFDPSVCLMPHQVNSDLQRYGDDLGKGIEGASKSVIRDHLGELNFTSYENTIQSNTSIGLIYFNLNHLIKRYEELALEEYEETKKGKQIYKKRFVDDFKVHDWISKIWNDVNEACAGFFDFGLHVEHERPNMVRIVDFTFSGGIKDTTRSIFEFDPQGLSSITRNIKWGSKLDEDFSAAISIAAQAPGEIKSLESLSFKAFHKNIRNRFTSNEFDDEDRTRVIKESYQRYVGDWNRYKRNLKSLWYYMYRLSESNFETWVINSGGRGAGVGGRPSEWTEVAPISSETAKLYAKTLEEQRIDLESRYPTHDKDGNPYDGSDVVNGKYTGQYRNNTTHYRSAIIPLTTTITLDGISGIVPLNVYKIDKDKLPIGYQDDDIIFTVKSETQRITAEQDWTTDITGYLTLLDNNPNDGYNKEFSGINPIKDLDEVDKERQPWVDYVTDVAWSAAFISYVVKRGIQGYGYRIPEDFHPSATHTMYLEANKDNYQWELLDPQITQIMVGDILVRPRIEDDGSMGNVKFPGPYEGPSHGVIVIEIVGCEKNKWLDDTTLFEQYCEEGAYARIVGGNYIEEKGIVAEEPRIPLLASKTKNEEGQDVQYANRGGIMYNLTTTSIGKSAPIQSIYNPELVYEAISIIDKIIPDTYSQGVIFRFRGQMPEGNYQISRQAQGELDDWQRNPNWTERTAGIPEDKIRSYYDTIDWSNVNGTGLQWEAPPEKDY